MRGGSPMTSSIARKVVASFQKSAASSGGKHGQLSPREQAVLEGLAKGWIYKQIAERTGHQHTTPSAPTSGAFMKNCMWLADRSGGEVSDQLTGGFIFGRW